MSRYKENVPLKQKWQMKKQRAREIDENEPPPGGSGFGFTEEENGDDLGALLIGGGLIAGGILGSQLINNNNSEEQDCSGLDAIKATVDGMTQTLDREVEKYDQSCFKSKNEIISFIEQAQREIIQLGNSTGNQCDPEELGEVLNRINSAWQNFITELDNKDKSTCCTYGSTSIEQKEEIDEEITVRAAAFLIAIDLMLNNPDNKLSLNENFEDTSNPLNLIRDEKERLIEYAVNVIMQEYENKHPVEFLPLNYCPRNPTELWTAFQIGISNYELEKIIQFNEQVALVRMETVEQLEREDALAETDDFLFEIMIAGAAGVIVGLLVFAALKNPVLGISVGEKTATAISGILGVAATATANAVVDFDSSSDQLRAIETVDKLVGTGGVLDFEDAERIKREMRDIYLGEIDYIESQNFTLEEKRRAYSNLLSSLAQETIRRISDAIRGDTRFEGVFPPRRDNGETDNRSRETLEIMSQYNFQPIALESVDCIGEQCETFPRLRYRVRVIQPGRSLNNYEYSTQMLQRSARLLEGVPVQAYGFGQYQPMFSHLPADVEPMQPSGFALNRVGVLKEPAYESHPDFGEGVFATLVVDKAAEGWAKAILDEATTPGGNGTGVSIFADIDGDYGYDDLTDEMYVKVNAIKNFRSVDLASQPAAGGAIVAAMEDAGWEQREYLEQLKEEIQKLSIEEIIEARRGYHRR